MFLAACGGKPCCWLGCGRLPGSMARAVLGLVKRCQVHKQGVLTAWFPPLFCLDGDNYSTSDWVQGSIQRCPQGSPDVQWARTQKWIPQQVLAGCCQAIGGLGPRGARPLCTSVPCPAVALYFNHLDSEKEWLDLEASGTTATQPASRPDVAGLRAPF